MCVSERSHSKLRQYQRTDRTSSKLQTSANGPNWVQALRTTYAVNPSIKGYNLAYGGATVDADFVTPYLPTVQSLKGTPGAGRLSRL